MGLIGWLCILGAMGGGVALYMLFVETRWFHLNRETIRVRSSFPGPLRILHLADAHFTGRDEAKGRFIRGLASEPVDFVFATGDMVDCPEGIDNCIRSLEALRPRYGTYFVFGGHDHYEATLGDVIHHLTHFRTSRRVSCPNDEAQILARLKEIGAKVLLNQNERVPVKGGEVVIVGLDDPFLLLHDLETAMEGVSEKDHTIVLVHAPEIVEEIADKGVDVAFSGHTHGGQVRVPFIGALVTRCSLETRFARGVFRRKNSAFHVSQGLGAGHRTNFRFACRPGATLVDIVPDGQPEGNPQ